LSPLAQHLGARDAQHVEREVGADNLPVALEIGQGQAGADADLEDVAAAGAGRRHRLALGAGEQALINPVVEFRPDRVDALLRVETVRRRHVEA
jgi:hypothetical protein